MFQYRPPDDGGVLQHHGYGACLADIVTDRFRQLAPRGTAAIQQFVLVECLHPSLQMSAADAVAAHIMETVLDIIIRQPAAGFFDGVAILDAIERCHGKGAAYISRSSSLMPTFERVFSSTRLTITAQ